MPAHTQTQTHTQLHTRTHARTHARTHRTSDKALTGVPLVCADGQSKLKAPLLAGHDELEEDAEEHPLQ
eukprot:2882487-Alexandrium_andersonii.AAC.1